MIPKAPTTELIPTPAFAPLEKPSFFGACDRSALANGCVVVARLAVVVVRLLDKGVDERIDERVDEAVAVAEGTDTIRFPTKNVLLSAASPGAFKVSLVGALH